jgi:shikimate dehydrogenase
MLLNAETRVCISVAAKPGGFGPLFHNFLYEKLGLNFVYQSFRTADLLGAIRGVRALGIRGCGVTMPFKEAVIPMLDDVDVNAGAIGAVNTIVNNDGRLSGYNTDYLAIRELIRERGPAPHTPTAVLGSGGVARAVLKVLRDLGYGNVVILARNPETGRTLGHAYGYAHFKPEDSVDRRDFLINASPVGFQPEGGELALPFTVEQREEASTYFDLVASPPDTHFLNDGRAKKKTVLTGFEVLCLQAREQFHLYTGVQPPKAAFEEARDYCRAKLFRA